MLIPRPLLERIVAGDVTLQFRRQRRPTVKTGGRLRTALGELAIDAVEPVALSSITAADARAAGAASRAELVDRLRAREGTVYRIAVRWTGDDPRVALRQAAELDDDAVAEIAAALDAIDARSRRGPWTREVLDLIARRPATLAAELATELGRERLPFKADVRRLKELGLTESLEVGYRLSPRGRAFRERDPRRAG
ncbi:hypothetical protein SK069_12560 [Patulibacter brassicae]|uniref:ASCH domain-containing protein n=1 Tax=Patulibacter brassicae TaxID=1705717 RepID=A0ABU4VM38_9ACTN|nr:hypothetical protein [Patulibacter brassicae]MDX8152432.1 hypothetical protein [Patulibacter brassicae]